jgi:hypothetical protein
MHSYEQDDTFGQRRYYLTRDGEREGWYTTNRRGVEEVVRYLNRPKQALLYDMGNERPARLAGKCKQCGKAFMPDDTVMFAYGRQTFCDSDCADAYFAEATK